MASALNRTKTKMKRNEKGRPSIVFKGRYLINSPYRQDLYVHACMYVCSVVSRVRHWVLDAQIVILDAQNSSECVNLDAQIVVLDTQNWSIGIQLVDFENWFQIWRMKSKPVCPNRFRKCIRMQIRCVNCRGDTFSTSLIGAFRSVYVVVYNSQRNQLILFPLTIKMKQATLFETRTNPAKRKATASEAPSETKPAKSFCHRWLNEFK